jgi:hypothetical protein
VLVDEIPPPADHDHGLAVMSRTPARFKQSDVTSIVKAVERAGKSVARVELGTDGKITIFVAGRDGTVEPATDPWEARANEEISIRSKF